jgi:hypothetical protein
MQLQPFQRVYGSLYQRLVQLWPEECDSRIVNMVFLMMGMMGARSVQSGRIAADVPVAAKKMSIVRRIERFLSNRAVRVREWYEPVARGIIGAASVAGQIQLVLDTTKVSAHHRLLMVGVAYRRRVLPLAWTWVLTSRGHSSTTKQVALLSYVRSLIPVGIQVSLVGDCEFGHPAVLEAMHIWHWDYALRQSGQLLAQLSGSDEWVRLDSLITQRGDRRFIPAVKLTAARGVTTHLMLYWDPRCPEPWLLATNLTPGLALRLYRRRAWIENMFGDLKGNGFDFERSLLRHFLHLSRLTLAVCLLYVWFLAFGTQIVQARLSSQVDRANRRDLSLFRIAWDSLHRALLLGLPFEVLFEPFFGDLPLFRPCGRQVSGG